MTKLKTIYKLSAISGLIGLLYMGCQICVWYGEYKVIKSPDLYYAGISDPASRDI